MLHRHLLPLLLALTPAAAAAGEADTPPAATPEPAAAPAQATAAPGADATVEKSASPQWSVMATAREEWRGRFASTATGLNESDQTARLFLDADGRSPSEAVALRASLGLWWRFSEDYKGEDGRPISLSSPRDPFFLDVYSLSAEWRPGGVVESIAGGRLEAEHGMPGAFDGLALTLKPTPPSQVFVFGGRSVHFFEVDPSLFENWMASVGAGMRGDWWKLEADYRFLTEAVPTTPSDIQSGREGEGGTVNKVNVIDHSYGLSGWFRYGEYLNTRVQLRGINDRFELIGLTVHGEYAPLEVGIDAKLDIQPSTLAELNLFDDPYFLTLGESKPHLKARVDLYKNFSTQAGNYGVHLGGDVRQLLDAEESAFNRNLLRGYAILSAQKVAGTGLYLSAIGEFDSFSYPNQATGGAGSSEEMFSVGGAIGWDQKPVKVELGTNYYAFRYVYFQSPEERANVREFYLDAKVNVLKWLSLRGRYSYEVFDRTIHTATISIAEAL
ncbi:MAG: hypothetical protein QM765_42700 [Myxococcales bacterium]